MRTRNGSKVGRVFGLAGAAETAQLEQLEGRRLLSADLAGVRLVLNGDGTAEVRQWTGEHDTIDDTNAGLPTRFQLTVNEQRFVGENDYTGGTPTIWEEFLHHTDGELGVEYGGSGPQQLGSAFRDKDGYELGWLIEGASGNPQTISFLHELPTAVSVTDMNGSWLYSSIALPTSGSAKSSTIAGAYGTIDIQDLAGNFTWNANEIGGTSEGNGQIQSLSAFGLGQISDSEYFAVSAGGNAMTTVDLSYGDGLTYVSVAVRRGDTLTTKEVAGEYRYGSAFGGDAATRRGADLLAFESVYLKLNLDGTLTAYDLADWDAGTQTIVHEGQWSLLPEGRTVLLSYEDIGEGHLVAFGTDKKTFIDLRVSHDNGLSYVFGQGQQVNEDDGSGDDGGGDDGGGGGDDGGGGGDDGGGGGDDYVDDFGSDDDGSGDTLTDNVPFPRLIVSGRAPTGRQAVWERGQDSQWYYSKLGLRTDTPGMIGELVTWQDEVTEAYMAAAATENGMILWVRSEDEGLYTKRDLTEESGENAEIPVGPATYMRLEDGRNVILSLNAAGDVIAYVESQGSTFFLNLSEDEIRVDDKVLPALTGTLTAGVSAWGTAIIAGLDAEGKVWTVWFSLQGNDGWQASPLSKIAAAEPLTGDLSIYFTEWNGINVVGLSETGEVRAIWWVPSFNGKWEVSNLTQKFDGPEFKDNTMITYVTPWNSMTIVGVTTTNRLVAYWWAPGFDAWVITDFSELLPQSHPRVIRGPIQVEILSNNDIWLFGRDVNDEMIRVAWTSSVDAWNSTSMVTFAEQF